MTTPRMTFHARARCAEMGVRTKVAKAIVRHATVVRPGVPGSERMVAVSDTHPDYAVVFVPGPPEVIVTVLFRTQVRYDRSGTTFIDRDEETQ